MHGHMNVNFSKTVILFEELTYIHIFMRCYLQAQAFEWANFQTKMSYQMPKTHKFRNNFFICSEQEVQIS
jgi:hypothetical protein